MSNWRRDLHAARDRDPAARNVLEVALLYAGVHAIWAHRLAHWLWVHERRFLGRAVSQLARGVTGIEAPHRVFFKMRDGHGFRRNMK